MTFSVGHVQNGTGAGWRRTRAKYLPWMCDCFVPEGNNPPIYDAQSNSYVVATKMNPGYLKKCIDCGTPRDQ